MSGNRTEKQQVTYCCGNDRRCFGGCDCQCHKLTAERDELQFLLNEAKAGDADYQLTFEDNKRLRAALDRHCAEQAWLRELILERQRAGNDLPIWLMLEWLDTAIRSTARPADSAGESHGG